MRKTTFTLFLILTFVFNVCISKATFAGIQADPIAHYTFNDGPEDASGNAYDGALVGDAYVDSGYLYLDGDGDAVLIPEIGIYSEVTIAMWVYPTSEVSSLQFSGGYNTDVWSTGAIHFKLGNGLLNVGISDATSSDVLGTTVVPTNEWSHIALTVSETEIALYYNGVNEATSDLTAAVDLVIGSAHIGAWNNGGTIERAMAGMMEEFVIYDVALTEEEVAELAVWDTVGTSLNKVAETIGLRLYPNPVNNVLEIKNASFVENVEIYNSVGNLVLKARNNNNAIMSVDASNLKNGIYMMRAYTSKGVTTRRFIKQ